MHNEMVLNKIGLCGNNDELYEDVFCRYNYLFANIYTNSIVHHINIFFTTKYIAII